jgi:hypothetical protein
MAYYLGNVTIGTVLVGVTSDNSTADFSSVWDALTALGVSVEDVKQDGSFAFVAQVGYSSRTMINKSLSHYDTAAALYVSLFGEMCSNIIYDDAVKVCFSDFMTKTVSWTYHAMERLTMRTTLPSQSFYSAVMISEEAVLRSAYF